VTSEREVHAGRALSLLAINLTRRCNLSCEHCYLDARTLRQGDPNELSTMEVQALLDDVAGLGHGTMIVLTGGEPLLRRDLEALISHGTALGLPMVVGTNGNLSVTTGFGVTPGRGQKPWQGWNAAAGMGWISSYIFRSPTTTRGNCPR
jgi:MoaA/NifB/PqqE/SkfB family radical SAM enzyme